VITQSFYFAHRKGKVREMVYVIQFRTLCFLHIYTKACRLKQDIQDLKVQVLWIQNFVCKCKRMELILFTTEFQEEQWGLIGSKGEETEKTAQ
jgi:hypothetical protein